MRSISILFILFLVLSPFCVFGQTVDGEFNRSILPIPDQPFKGKIGLRASDSVKDFPKEVKAPEGAPNIPSRVWERS